MKIAIVGSGISGLTCAHMLHKKHDITLFEAGSYVGGHTNTIEVLEDGKKIPIDTGFIVFNKKTYPNFLRLIEKLGVSYQKTAMSFSVKSEKTGLEYNGTSLNSLFAQRSNIFKPKFISFVLGILDFNKKAKSYLNSNEQNMLLGDFIKKYEIRSAVVEQYLVPMAAAVWSADLDKMWDFPARFLLRFWENHGFLEVNERPQWYVISGGSYSYVKKIIKPFSDKITLNSPVKAVHRKESKVHLETADSNHVFDAVIFACHSDDAIKILQDGSEKEKKLLNAIPFQKNTAILHSDTDILPKKKLAWAAWNYHLSAQENPLLSVTYNMNILQSLDTKKIYNVTLNPLQEIPRDKIIRSIEYKHPTFTNAGCLQQDHYKNWLGENNTYFCGAYLRNGFHEDGVVTAMNVCQHLGGEL
ncbi:MAG: FAD-dependent oxidoreductase [Oligoflexales bacterium]|nr:FAD-dependent oxidoreductase [Oligoflexales bacterium]